MVSLPRPKDLLYHEEFSVVGRAELQSGGRDLAQVLFSYCRRGCEGPPTQKFGRLLFQTFGFSSRASP